MLDGDPVLFNRQPTLHRMSMMCHRAKIMHKGSTFRLNVAVTKPYNADFDGDEMNLHGPQDEESQAELIHLAAVPKQIISPANNSSIIGIFQDSLLGCYRFTRSDIKFTPREAMNLLMYYDNPKTKIFEKNKKKKISNFDLLTQILPPLSLKFKNGQFNDSENKKTSNNIVEVNNGKYLRGQIDKKTLGSGSKGIIQRIFNDYNYNKSEKFIDDLQAIITEYMKLSSYSVGVSDLIANNETNRSIIDKVNTKKKEVNNLIDQMHLSVFENNSGKTNNVEFETQTQALLNAAASEAGGIGKNQLSEDNRFLKMVKAGSKGSVINIAQMISCLGQQNVDGKRIPYGFDDRTLPHYTKFDDSAEARGFVESSFIHGLTPEEVYFHAMGGRTGLIDTAVKTSQTGYIQRRLIKGCEDLKVCYDMTIRNNKNKIIQFSYGDDNVVTTKVENQSIPIVNMSLEEIYAHWQIPDTSKVASLNYTKKTLSKMKKQKKKLTSKTKEILNYIIEKRDKLARNVFKFQDNTIVHIPVHFERNILNIKNNLRIKGNFFVDITPLDLYEKIDDAFEMLEHNPITKPTELFKILWYYYLSPKNLLVIHRFNEKAVNLLIETLIYNYKRAIISPGEMVGMVAAQSIGEPTTQMTLNTFHFAGVASKSNVTRGVPRIEEILSLSENPKKPSICIRLKDEEETSQERAQELKYMLEYTSLKDVTTSVSICFDPNVHATLIDEDKELMERYLTFEKLMDDCGIETQEDEVQSKWIIRIKLSREEMLDRNITMDEIHFAIKNSLKQSAFCIFSDFNSENLIFRIRFTDNTLASNKKAPLDQTDEIYKLKNIQENILNNIVLRGVKKIPKIILRKVPNILKKSNGNYSSHDIWVLDTVGTNLKDVLALDCIDAYKTFSNDIQEVYRTLGIEAARQCIYNEIEEAFEANGNYINYHHLSILCDRICATKKMVSIFRHGINNDDIGPIAKASFEETPEMFLKAAKHAELDLMTGVSANVMCGQEGYFGTGAFQVLVNLPEMKKLGEKYKENEENIDYSLELENNTDVCSIQNLTIDNEIKDIGNVNTGKLDDDYDIDF